MKKPNKKAMLFNITLVFVTIIVLTAAFAILVRKNSQFDTGIGKRQTQLIKTYQEADKLLLYIDHSARLTTETTLYNLAQKGGYKNKPSCGSSSDYTFWRKKDQECYPEKISLNFKKLFDISFDQYIFLYNRNNELKFPTNNYEYTIYQDNIIGTAFENIELEIPSSGISKYSFKPSFNIPLNFDLNIYTKTIEQAKQLVNCNLNNNPEQCRTDLLTTDEYKDWTTNKQSNTYFFDIKTGKTIWIYTDLLKQEEIIIKFAIDFS
jgi:hypothetical protein